MFWFAPSIYNGCLTYNIRRFTVSNSSSLHSYLFITVFKNFLYKPCFGLLLPHLVVGVQWIGHMRSHSSFYFVFSIQRFSFTYLFSLGCFILHQIPSVSKMVSWKQENKLLCWFQAPSCLLAVPTRISLHVIRWSLCWKQVIVEPKYCICSLADRRLLVFHGPEK